MNDRARLARACRGRRIAGLVLGLTLAGGSEATTGSTDVDPILEAGLEIARNARLAELGCPLGESLAVPAYFHQQNDGAAFEAHAAVVLPLPYADAADTILAVERYPEWALTDLDGTPVLREPRFDRDTGIHEIRLAAAQAPPVRARVRQVRETRRTGVSFSPTDGDDLDGMFLEATVAPADGCPQASLVTLRLGWEVGWLGRLVVGKVSRTPAVFLLKIRGDLVAHALGTPEHRALLLSGKGKRDDKGWRYDSHHLGEGFENVRLGRVYPAYVELPPGRVKRLAPQIEKVRGGSRKLGDHLGLLLDALEGRHRIAGYTVNLTGGENRAFTTVGDPATMSYDVFLRITDEGGSLGMSVDFSDDAP